MKLISSSSLQQSSFSLTKKRIVAFFIDLVCISVMEKLISMQLYYTFQEIFKHVPKEIHNNFTDHFSSLRLAHLILIFWSYFLISNLLSDGKTLGKLIMKLKIVSQNDQEPLIKQYFLRSFGYLFCYMTGSFLFLMPLLNSKAVGVPDWISKTKVIEDPENKDYRQKEGHDPHEDQTQLKLFA